MQLLFQVNVLVAVSFKQELHHLSRWNALALRYQFLNALLKWAAQLVILHHVFFLIVTLPAYPEIPNVFGNETGQQKTQTLTQKDSGFGK